MNNNKQKAADSTPAKDNTFRSGLTPIQEKAAIMLANGDSVTLVAETLNVNRTTIYQWQQKVIVGEACKRQRYVFTTDYYSIFYR